MPKPHKVCVRRPRPAKDELHSVKAGKYWQLFGERYRLTPVELRAVQLLAEGLSDKQIAAAMSRTLWDAKKHLQNVREKLKVHSRTEIFKVFVEFQSEMTQSHAPNTPP